MDQLDILKSKWQSQKSDYPTYSTEQITSLLAKKSSSIVKWIFYIGIAEFLILGLITIFYTGNSAEHDNMVDMIGQEVYYGSYVVSYVVILFFIYKFWKNYKNISADQPSRTLMKNILKTRKTMKYYIWFNLIYVMLFGMIVAVLMVFNNPEFAEIVNSEDFQEHKFKFMAGYILFTIVLLATFCAVLYGVYSLIYGILLKRLKKNYQELKKMEV